MKRLGVAAAAVLGAGAFFWWGPDLRVRLGERGERANLGRLGRAVGLYMADFDGRYPLLATGEASGIRVVDGRPVGGPLPLSPYLKEPGALFSTGTHLPYGLRFVRELHAFDPRDPMGGLVRRDSILPDPHNVVAASAYEEGWRYGWRSASLRTVPGIAPRGHAYLLRGDLGVELVDLAEVRQATFDAKGGHWSEPEPAVRKFTMEPWQNAPWTIFPNEPWPTKTAPIQTG